MIGDDAYAMSFQTTGQYRSAILKNIDQMRKEEFSILYDNEYVIVLLYRDKYETIPVIINKRAFENASESKQKIGTMFYADSVSPVERGSFLDERLLTIFKVK